MRDTEVKPGVRTVALTLPFRMGSVNCYVVRGSSGFVLVDTGPSNRRAEIERELESGGCRPGDLALIILTHGDFDHTGNAACLRRRFGGRIAMHRDDEGMLEHGDIFWNRKARGRPARALAGFLFRFGQTERCRPDVYVDEGDDLSPHGLEARVLHIPGHSRGSIAVLTAQGALFCGDLLERKGRPALNRLIDDRAAARASFERLKGLAAETVYPGHGPPFPAALFRQDRG